MATHSLNLVLSSPFLVLDMGLRFYHYFFQNALTKYNKSELPNPLDREWEPISYHGYMIASGGLTCFVPFRSVPLRTQLGVHQELCWCFQIS
ncbi:hypothetical protein K443DRAFT_443029 [Laccaria amethystina LaAM-08-1]|uniref:Uncharacterized protein n=1 Tax=Laccaria amethystina LaAM-08-1 TaxID=1095629 RepID=A0A0C9Y7M7_9AGAR|nr:hypothetical protein K443DRAFT_443029 [Laccaria amethystina LaAM-08-1]